MGGQDHTSDEILCSRNMEPPDLTLEQAPDGTAWSRLVHSPLLAWFGSSPPSLSQAHTLSASLCLYLAFTLSPFFYLLKSAFFLLSGILRPFPVSSLSLAFTHLLLRSLSPPSYSLIFL